MNDGLVYANAVARSKENGMLTDERLTNLFKSSSLEEGVRVLTECGYGGGFVPSSPTQFEEILIREESALTEFVLSVPDVGLELFFLKDDYHNLKCLLKAHYAGTSTAAMLKKASISPDRLRAGISGENPLENEMGEGVREVAERMKAGLSPRVIDCVMDKAYYREVNRRAKKANPLLRVYFQAETDTQNIDSFARTVRIGGDEVFFSENFLEGGSLSKDYFTERLPLGLEGLNDAPYADLIKVLLADGLIAFETKREDYLLRMMKAERYDMFGVAPLVGYYLAKRAEIRMVRTALVCIKNGLPQAEMEKRKREQYA